MAQKKTLGILVGGGPAPGINSVISSATIEALNSGMKVIGIYDGYKWFIQKDISHITHLTIADVSRIHLTGGSILRTSRENPVKKPNGVANAISSFKRLGITHVVAIGGEDTCTSSAHIAKAARGSIKIVHVPKTIDNDLPLPHDSSTFGFQTARHVGAFTIQNLMEDAQTTSRWYVVVTMGRAAGFLAFGIGFAAGATLSIIPEEFPQKPISLDQITDIIEGTIIKRKYMGRNNGVIILSEGLAEHLLAESIKGYGTTEYDEFGHVRLAEIDLGKVVKDAVKKRFEARKQKITIVDKRIGYELRSCAPIPFDVDYTRKLGYGAVRYLLEGPGKALIHYEGGRLAPIKFEKIYDAKTQKVRSRQVDVRSEYYKVATSYMIKLTKEDLENKSTLNGLAKAAGISPKDIREKFKHLL
ncbi:diphosphate--fructose-6-phosphate 1-phosphotransferase [Elusimicrobiota bacterium]